VSDPQRGRRRSSSVLDAIFEAVDEHPERSAQATQLFRAKALEQLDVAKEIDNQLPLVARRTWLILAGAAVLAAAFVMWAALTPSESSVPTGGRIVAADGIVPVTSTLSGTLTTAVPASGTEVSVAQPIAEIATVTGPDTIVSLAAGTIWQVLAELGSGVQAGTPIATVLPTGSERTAVLIVPEYSAGSVKVGQKVSVNTPGPVTGSVTAIGAPLTALDVSQRYGLAIDATTMLVPVYAALDQDVTPGSAVSGRIILSNQSVLGRILGRS
jgi:biotin carboxyl carrier protein